VSSEISIPQDLCLDGPLWQFAGRLWSQPGTQGSALTLQARGWSVTDILCALWLTGQGRRLDMAEMEPAINWRGQVTEPLRNARKAVAKHNPATNQAREWIARSELEAEKVELALAYRALTGDNPAKTDSNESTVDTLALENLQTAAPEKVMDNETGRLLEILIEELKVHIKGERQPCS